MIEITPQINSGECVVCREAITNPICPDCLAAEAKVWLNENAPDLTGFVSKPETVTRAFLHIASKCVVCGKEMSVCPHCYSRDIFQELAQESPSTAAKFARVFNYEFAKPRVPY
ncbi:hypothetical protein D6764_03635 [Candidatus Woesearchaeota archaeon]|nr:MAG: hypothetical protein D6764_03635 [Candidatus Woesearchaeota archaeon]